MIVRGAERGHKVMESRMEPSPCGGWIYMLRNELDMRAGKRPQGGGKVQDVWDGDRLGDRVTCEDETMPASLKL